MYSKYITFLQSINAKNLSTINFKRNPAFTEILEHVSFDLGTKYIYFIENEFNNISIENIKNFIQLNDKIGNPVKYSYLIKNEIIESSPSSLRYIYNALVILQHYTTKNTRSVVEVGCGYGGLFLAIDFFSKLLNIPIDNYYIIDLPEVGNLIAIYLDYHKDVIGINYSIHDASLYGSTVENNELFFISNYCFTEIDENHRLGYVSQLLSKVSCGFIIWQTGLISIDTISSYIKQKYDILEEKPQTSGNYKNYFVQF